MEKITSMPLLEKFGARRIKYNLLIQVHTVKANFRETGPIKVLVLRGKQKQETQQMPYNHSEAQAILEYPVSFTVNMMKKGKTFLKKFVNFTVLEVTGKSTKELGRAVAEFSEIAANGVSFTKIELLLKKCTDKNGKLIISVHLTPFRKGSRSMATGDIPSSNFSLSTFQTDHKSSLMGVSVISSDEESGINNLFERSHFGKQSTELGNAIYTYKEYSSNEENSEGEGPRLHRRSSKSVIDPPRLRLLLEDSKKPSSGEASNTFLEIAKEHIINPKESCIASESSSSDEEVVAFDSYPSNLDSIPRREMTDVRPNENSKLTDIKEKEVHSGIAGRSGTCAKCGIF